MKLTRVFWTITQIQHKPDGDEVYTKAEVFANFKEAQTATIIYAQKNRLNNFIQTFSSVDAPAVIQRGEVYFTPVATEVGPTQVVETWYLQQHVHAFSVTLI